MLSDLALAVRFDSHLWCYMRWFLKMLILFYRATLGRFLGGHCRFYPSCSQYAQEAIDLYGPWRGGWRALRRICRCRPGGGGGFDPP